MSRRLFSFSDLGDGDSNARNEKNKKVNIYGRYLRNFRIRSMVHIMRNIILYFVFSVDVELLIEFSIFVSISFYKVEYMCIFRL